MTSTPGEALAEGGMLTPIPGVYIRPYFDDAGKTELAVRAGEQFDILVYAETVAPCSTNAAQFRLDVPPGVDVTSVTELEQRALSMGKYDTGYSIAYQCQPVGKFRIVTFHCVARPGFRGGEVSTGLGVGGDEPYLGFSTCTFEHAPATSGKALLKEK